MVFLRTLVISIAVLALLIGLLWIGQGTGLVMWPSSSFMLADKQWAWNGLFLSLAALWSIWCARRR